MHVPRVEAALQLLQRLISLAEPGVQERHRVGRNIPLARDGFQCIQHLPGFVRAPQFCQQVPPSATTLLLLPESRPAFCNASSAKSLLPNCSWACPS